MPHAGWPAVPVIRCLLLSFLLLALPVAGRTLDHMAIDPARKRLWVAELGNCTVDAIDLTTGQIAHSIEGLREPQGIGYAPKADVMAVASAGDGSVRLFRAGDFAPLAVIDLHDDADSIRLDPRTGTLVVGYGSGALALLDPSGPSVISRIALPAHPESFQIDPDARRAFVNLPDAQQIGVVDLAAGRQVATWRMPGLRGNFPMALDAADATLATVFRNPPRLVLLDARDGKVQANLATCGDADDVFFDARRERIYVSCGEGSVDVFARQAAAWHRVAQIRTASGARTALFVPDLDRLFVAARAGFFGFGSNAAILVFRPQP